MVQNSSTLLEDLMKEYSEIFRDELRTVRGFQASLHLKGSPQPKFFRPRPVPFAIRDAVGHELDRLEADMIIEKVTHTEWAALIVAASKKDGQLRICGDYKVQSILSWKSISTYYHDLKSYLLHCLVARN